jgi:tetratricopeptide (TPR) repeat protein
VNQKMPFEKHIKILLNLKRYREALLICLKWVDNQPGDANAWFFKAFSETNAHKPNAGFESIERALELKPGNSLMLALKAQILGVLGKTDECLEILDDLLGGDALHPSLLHQIGATLNNIGQYDRAATIFEQVRDVDPENIENIVSLATAYHILGRSSDAATLHRQAIELQPENFRAYWLLGQLEKATPENNLIEFFESSLARYSKALQARICLNFALAKQYEDVADYDNAISCLHLGSEGVLEHTPYDQEKDEALYRTTRRDWSEEFFHRRPRGYVTDEPVFIVGMPRTGTTLLEQILTTYDDIETAGELHNFSRLMNKACMTLNPQASVDDIYADIDRIDFASLGRDYVRSARLQVPNSPRFIDKYPLNFLMVGAILTALPKARVINLRRNPMDTCFSNYKLLFRLGTALHTYNLKTLGAYYLRYDKLMRHWHKAFPGNILDVRYESLVTESETETRKVADFLGLEWRPECLDFYKSGSAVATASVTQVRRPINTGSLYKWRKLEKHLVPLSDYFAECRIDVE